MSAETATTILYCLFFFFLGVAAVLAIGQRFYANYRKKLDAQAEDILAAAKREAETRGNEMIVRAKEQSLEIKAQLEHELAGQRAQQSRLLEKLEQRESKLSAQEEGLVKQQRGLENSQTRLTKQMQSV